MFTQEIEAILSYFEPSVVKRYVPATEEMIVNAEHLLGLQFPPSLRTFLQVSNGLKVSDWIEILGVPQVGEEPVETIVDWSLTYREPIDPEEESAGIVVLIQDGTGDPFGLLTSQRDDRGEYPITKFDHETREPKGAIASSFDRLLWFVLTDLTRFLLPNGEYDRTQRNEEKRDENWVWYQDSDYCLQHDPNLESLWK